MNSSASRRFAALLICASAISLTASPAAAQSVPTTLGASDAAVVADTAMPLLEMHRRAFDSYAANPATTDNGKSSLLATGADDRVERSAVTGRSAYHLDTRSYSLGGAISLGDGMAGGLLATRAVGDAFMLSHQAAVDTEATIVSGFLGYRAGGLSAYFNTGYGWLGFGTTRTLGTTTAAGQPDGHVYFFDGRAAYTVEAGPFSITPQSELRYARVVVDTYDESAPGGVVTSVSDQKRESLIHSIGLLTSAAVPIGSFTLRPFASIAFEHELFDGRWTASNTSAGQRLQVEARPGDRDWFEAKLGMAADLAPGVTASVSYAPQASREGDERRSWRAGVNVSF